MNKKIYVLIFVLISVFKASPQQNGIQITNENNRMSKNIVNGEIHENILMNSKKRLTNEDKKRIETAIQMQVEAHRKMKKIEEEHRNAYLKTRQAQVEAKREAKKQRAAMLGEQAAAEKARQLAPSIEKTYQEFDNRGNLSLHRDKVNVKNIQNRQMKDMTPQPVYIYKNTNNRIQSAQNTKKSLSKLLTETENKEYEKKMTDEEYKRWLIKNVPEYRQLVEEETELEKLIFGLN